MWVAIALKMMVHGDDAGGERACGDGDYNGREDADDDAPSAFRMPCVPISRLLA
jgi:hypothetical protein